jgi:Ca2+-binding RTX toxin-like protein
MYRYGNYFFGDWTSEIFSGTAGNDYFHAADGNDAVYAGNGNDTLGGGRGDDYLWGGSGADVLDGDWGKDTLIGGSSYDTFEFFTPGGSRLGPEHADFVADFNQYEGDTIQISGGYFGRYFGMGKLDANEFCYSGQAYSGPHVIYDPGSGALYLDASTTDGISAQVFAYLQPNTPLDHGAIWFS